MYLHRKDIEKIVEVLEKFPDLHTFELVHDNSSGIGSYVAIRFDHNVNDVKGTFEVEVSGVEDW